MPARIVVMAAALALVAGVAFAQSATLDVRPPSVSVAPWDQSAEARVVILNNGKVAITGATLMLFSNDSIAATVDPAPAPRLEPSDSFAWKLSVDLTKARVPGLIELDASFTVVGESRPRHVFHQLKFEAASGVVIDKAIEATLSGSFDAVNETRPGRGYVVVVNNLDVAATISDIRVQTSDPDSFGKDADFDVSSNRSAPFAAFDVPARSSQSQFIELRASPSVASGKHRIVLAVDAKWVRHGQPQERTILVGQDVTLGVFFESELLKALGVPSFLVLPGCLFLFAIQLLLKFEVGGDNRPAKFPDLSATSSGFWIIAITWSGLFAWAFAVATGNDYLNRYGARDLRNVWLVSIILGVIVYWAMVTRNKMRHKNRPTKNDDAMTTLEKMGGRGLKLRVQKAEVTLKNAPLTVFIVDDTDSQAVWAVPPIEARWTGDKTTLSAKQAIIELINSGSAADLVAALDASKNAVTVDFNFDGSLQRPTAFAAADIKPVGEEPLVKVS